MDARFLSTLSLRRATATRKITQTCRVISIHALLAESDKWGRIDCGRSWRFLSTLSLRRATETKTNEDRYKKFLSTLSLRRATFNRPPPLASGAISIHALLAESDRKLPIRLPTALHFYPRSPCGERPALAVLLMFSLYFYPRSPCGERRQSSAKSTPEEAFLSTLSLRRATTWARGSRVTYVISIHALLAESDRIVKRCQALDIYFYPRSPCGERPPRVVREPTARGFLSTLSLRRATARRESRQQPAGISIHALLAESDSKSAQNSGALLRI